MDRLIKLDPSNTISIRIEPNQKCHGHVTLCNVMHTMPVAFNLQPQIKCRYTVKPHSGIISPLTTLTVEISYNLPQGSTLPDSFPRSKDTFLLHSCVVPGAAINEPSSMVDCVPSEWFSAKKKQVFVDTGIKIVFLGSTILVKLIGDDHGSMDDTREVLERSDPSWKAVDSIDSNGETLLHLAISRKRADVVQLLLEFEANLEARNGSGSTPLEAAASSGAALIAELLLAHKANIERQETSTFGPIHVAAKQGHCEVLRLLLLKGARVDSLTKDGNTALHLAVEENKIECVKLLLANGARTDIRNAGKGDTVLHIAASTGDHNMVELLLRNGVNKYVRNDSSKAAYDVAAEKGHSRIFDALRLGDDLCIAARKGEVRSIQKLLEKGAFVNGRDQNGWTPLHRACFKGRIDAVHVLLEKGIDLNAEDEEGYTALHCAVECGNADVAEVLVKKGADVEARSKKGITALQVAKALRYVGITRILVNGGASTLDHQMVVPDSGAVVPIKSKIDAKWKMMKNKKKKKKKKEDGGGGFDRGSTTPAIPVVGS
ncbi:protein VAPYRIN-like [Arachis stenosperma]|uniref:protein VAPYRIN-like n=1 Tax=Arachis stenosperma TaxID=217475 RepID=UPI0025AC11F9|nr:protein VAPYRIN-like [Arachis stenosperma]